MCLNAIFFDSKQWNCVKAERANKEFVRFILSRKLILHHKKQGRPLVVHRFSKSFSVSKMGPSNRTKAECRNRVQEKTKFGKKYGKTPAATPSPFHIPKPAKTQS